MPKPSEYWKAALSNIRKFEHKKVLKKDLSKALQKTEGLIAALQKEVAAAVAKAKPQVIDIKTAGAFHKRIDEAYHPSYEIIEENKTILQRVAQDQKARGDKAKNEAERQTLKFENGEVQVLFLALGRLGKDLGVEDLTLKVSMK